MPFGPTAIMVGKPVKPDSVVMDSPLDAYPYLVGDNVGLTWTVDRGSGIGSVYLNGVLLFSNIRSGVQSYTFQNPGVHDFHVVVYGTESNHQVDDVTRPSPIGATMDGDGATYSEGASVTFNWTVDPSYAEDEGDVYLNDGFLASGHSGTVAWVANSTGSFTAYVKVAGGAVQSNSIAFTVNPVQPTSCNLDGDGGSVSEGTPFALNWSVDQGSDVGDVYIDDSLYLTGVSSGQSFFTDGQAGSHTAHIVVASGVVFSNTINFNVT